MAINWAYLAGIFDGEGNLCMPFGAKNTLLMSITQAGPTGIKLLTEIQEFLASNGVKSRIESGRPIEGRQIVYRLLLGSIGIETFVKCTMPFLIVKKVIAQDVMRFRTLYPSLSRSPQGKLFRRELAIKNNGGVKTHCSKGHLYKRTPKGRLWCKECANEYYNTVLKIRKKSKQLTTDNYSVM